MGDNGVAARVDGDRVLVTTGWLCANLPTTRKTLTIWSKEGMPKHSRGWWDLLDVLAWRGLVGTEGAANQDAVTLQQKKLAFEAALKEEQAEFARFRNEMNAKRFIPRSEVESELTSFFTVFRKSALMIPRRVAGEISHQIGSVEAKELEARLMDMVCDALEQMSVDGVYNASG